MKQFINSQHLYPDSNYGQPNMNYLMMGINNAPIPEGLDQRIKIYMGRRCIFNC